MIYVYVFHDAVFKLEKTPKLDIGEWLLSGGVRPASNVTDLHTQKYPGMALLLASRQTHHEVALHPYKLATFDFGVSLTRSYVGIGPKEMAMKYFLRDRSMAQAEVLGKMQVCKRAAHWYARTIWTGDAAYWAAELGYEEYFS